MPAKTAKTVKAKPGAKGSKTKKSKKIDLKYTIDCTGPVDDEILKVASLVEFLKERVKYNGKTGQLAAGGIEIAQEGKYQVVATAKTALSKRYLKYLTKKYLKRNSLRDWLRVVASNKNAYELRYFQIQDEEEESDEE